MFRFALSLIVACIFQHGIIAQDKKEPIRVLIIDGQNNHNWRATTPVLKDALEKSGPFQVAVTTFLKEGDAKPGAVKETVPFPPDLSKFDVVREQLQRPALARRVSEGLR